MPSPGSPRTWTEAGLRAPSPPLPCSLMGRKPRTVTETEVRRGLPPGVVVFPSGNMLLTASVGARRRTLPENGCSTSGDLRYVEFHKRVIPANVEVILQVSYSEEEAIQLKADFKILRMTFPVRYVEFPVFQTCKSLLLGVCFPPAAAALPCWQNNTLIPGVSLWSASTAR